MSNHADPAQPTLAVLPYWDRFEDFYDKLGISLADYEHLTGGWLFNYVDALHSAGVESVILYASARVSSLVRFRHASTGARVVVLPTPRLNHQIRNARERYAPTSRTLRALASYAATPLNLLARELRQQGCGAILCQEYSYARFDTAVLLGQRLGLPVFATFQGGSHQLSLIEVVVRYLSLRACTGLIVAATNERQYVRSHYGLPEQKVAAIPNPIDVAGWEPEDRVVARRQLGLPVDAQIVVWHGRVEVDVKGLDVLLDAWHRLTARVRETKLILLLVGTGRDAALLRDLLRTRDSEGVVWIDRYISERIELWRFLSAANVYALPSRREGFPIAPLEAMACGLPVVAADVSGVRDILQDGSESAGIVVPTADPAALAVGLAQALLDPELASRLGARGRQRVRDAYSPRIVGNQLRAFMTARGAFPHAVR